MALNVPEPVAAYLAAEEAKDADAARVQLKVRVKFRAKEAERAERGGTNFSPTSVQFKVEISDACPRKRHQQRHLEFCTAYLLSRGSGVRVSPGAPSH